MQEVNAYVLKQLETSPFFNHIGFELFRYDDDQIGLRLPLKEELLNTNKTVHGGVHASMLAMIQTTVLHSIYQAPAVAMNLDVHYFTATNAGNLYAKAKILQKGYKLATVEAEIQDDQQQVVAKGTGIYKILRKT